MLLFNMNISRITSIITQLLIHSWFIFYLHQDTEGARAGAIGAGEEIVEVNAVGVVLPHAWQLKPGRLPHRVLRDIHIHVGAWMQR